MKVYVVTGAQDDGYLYSPHVFSTREKALTKMEKLAKEEQDFQEQENDDVLELVWSDDGNAITLECENEGVVFLFELTEVEVE